MNNVEIEHALQFPIEWPESDKEMSNFDHVIDEGMEQDLRNGMTCSHPAYDNYGKVWFQDGKFHEEVWVYGTPRSIISSESLRNLMDIVNEKFGYQ